MSRFDPEEQERIEGQILYLIDRVNSGSTLHWQLVHELNKLRTRLRNTIMIYKEHRTEAEVDDLIAAIIKDRALSTDEIILAFDLDLEGWDQCLKRIKEERKW